MRIVVVGVGAMGGLWAARLGARPENEVWALETSTAVVSEIERNGIRIEGPEGGLAVRPRVTTDAAAIPRPDVVYVFVKAHHTASAAESLLTFIGPESTVVTLQNGLGNADVLAAVVDPSQIVYGVTYHSATMSDGVIRHNAAGTTKIAPYLESSGMHRAEAVAEVMNRAGFEVGAMSNVLPDVWRKLVVNASATAVSGLTGLRPGDIDEVPDVAQLIEDLAREAVAVAQARGYNVSLEDPMNFILRARKVSGKGSMLQDIEARRKTEVEVLNGAVVREGVIAGVPTPKHEAMVALIHGIERSWRS